MRAGSSFGERPCRRFSVLIPLPQTPAEACAGSLPLPAAVKAGLVKESYRASYSRYSETARIRSLRVAFCDA